MKAFKSLILKASAVVAVGFLAGCGGGGSGGGGGGVPPAGGLTPEKANAQLTALASELGCSYSAVAVSGETKTAMALTVRAGELLAGAMTEGSIASNLTAPEIASSELSAGTLPAIAAVQPGTCGGSVTMPDFGFGTYTFNNFCYSDPASGATATINGSLELGTDGSTISFATPSPLHIISSNPAGDVTINVGGGILGLDGSGNINSLTIASLNVTDNTTGTSYSATNINITLSGSTVGFSATVNDPGVGTLYIEGSANPDTRQLAINVSDTAGSVVSVSGIGGIYDASFDGSPIGTLDCSMVTIPTIPTLPI